MVIAIMRIRILPTINHLKIVSSLFYLIIFFFSLFFFDSVNFPMLQMLLRIAARNNALSQTQTPASVSPALYVENLHTRMSKRQTVLTAVYLIQTTKDIPVGSCCCSSSIAKPLSVAGRSISRRSTKIRDQETASERERERVLERERYTQRREASRDRIGEQEELWGTKRGRGRFQARLLHRAQAHIESTCSRYSHVPDRLVWYMAYTHIYRHP